MSSLTKMVKQECANLKKDRCLFTETGACPVIEGHRCPVSRAVLFGGSPKTPGIDYFATCVAPLAATRTEYLIASAEYAQLCGEKPVAVRHCACGAALAKGKQCCTACKRKRSREAKRKWWSETRSKLPKSSA